MDEEREEKRGRERERSRSGCLLVGEEVSSEKEEKKRVIKSRALLKRNRESARKTTIATRSGQLQMAICLGAKSEVRESQVMRQGIPAAL